MTTAAPIQAWLPLKVELRLPTLSMTGARSLLGLHENLIKEQTELGALIAWDISRSGTGRREYRFLAASVRAWREARTFDEPEIVKLVYGVKPGERPAFLYGSWFCRCWNCDSGHTINLIEDKVLALVPKTDYSRGRGRTPCITWSSALDFLKTRRLT
jgi:hypothetical protein